MTNRLSKEERRRQVTSRAANICEYCQTSGEMIGQTLHIEHIVPGGGDGLDNLCLSCPNCNFSKLDATSTTDPETEVTVPLFNPRTQGWYEHFTWADNFTRVVGITPTGRATVARLKMNKVQMLVARRRWVEAGYHPPL